MRKQIIIIAIAAGIYSFCSPTSMPESAENLELLSLKDE
jgi:hypothetical protein